MSLSLTEEELKLLEEEEENEKYELLKEEKSKQQEKNIEPNEFDENEPLRKKVKKNPIPYVNNYFVKKINEYVYLNNIDKIKEYLLSIDITIEEVQKDICWVLIKEKHKHHYSKKIINEIVEFLLLIGFEKKYQEIIEMKEVFSIDTLKELFIIKNLKDICEYISNVNYWENQKSIINIFLRENNNLSDEFIKEIMKFLISININFNYKNQNGLSPLKISIFNKNIEMCKILISIKACIDDKDIIHVIIKNKDINIFKLFFDNHILNIINLDLNYQDNEGITPLILSIFHCQYEMCKILLENGADINLKNINDENALMIACNNRYIYFNINVSDNYILKQEIINILIEKGIDINEKDKYDRTALYYALSNVNEFSIFMIISLLEAGADPNLLDLNLNNALQTLIIENDSIENSYGLSLMMILINYGTSKTHRNDQNENIYDLLNNEFLQYFQMFDSLSSSGNTNGNTNSNKINKIFISKSCLICFEEDKRMIYSDSCKHIVNCYDCFIKLHAHQQNSNVKCPYCNIVISSYKIVENIS